MAIALVSPKDIKMYSKYLYFVWNAVFYSFASFTCIEHDIHYIKRFPGFWPFRRYKWFSQ